MINANHDALIDYGADNRFQFTLTDENGLGIEIGENDSLFFVIGDAQKPALVEIGLAETTDGKIEVVSYGVENVSPAIFVVHLYTEGTHKLRENAAYQGDFILIDFITGRTKLLDVVAFSVMSRVRRVVALPLLAIESIESNEIEPIPILEQVLQEAIQRGR